MGLKMKDKIIDLATNRPKMSLADIGREVGATGEYVRQVLKKANVVKPRAPMRGENATPKIKITTNTGSHINIGAASEMLVCADLLARGYSVFRSVSGHASCDLICYKKDDLEKLIRVEVRTAKKIKDNIVYAKPDGKRYDLLALAVHGEVVYVPPL